MEVIEKVLNWLLVNWLDVSLVLVGLSAFAVYFFQRRSELYTAGTLIIGQINLIEQRVTDLKNEHQLNNVAVYHSKPIIKDSMWEKYKHLFASRLTNAEYEMIQDFFDQAEQLERARLDIITTMSNAWKDKSSAEQQNIARIICEEDDCKKAENKINTFEKIFIPLDVVFTPDVAIKVLTKSLANFSKLSGTTSYNKIHKKSYSK